jgi:hypothetical protein
MSSGVNVARIFSGERNVVAVECAAGRDLSHDALHRVHQAGVLTMTFETRGEDLASPSVVSVISAAPFCDLLDPLDQAPGARGSSRCADRHSARFA